jgi:hypothetical protein
MAVAISPSFGLSRTSLTRHHTGKSESPALL